MSSVSFSLTWSALKSAVLSAGVGRWTEEVVGDDVVDDEGFTVNIVVVAVKFDGRKSQLFVTKPAVILVIARLLNISSWSLSCGLLESLSLGKFKSVLDYTKCLCEIRNSVEPYLRR